MRTGKRTVEASKQHQSLRLYPASTKIEDKHVTKFDVDTHYIHQPTAANLHTTSPQDSPKEHFSDEFFARTTERIVS